MKIFFMLCAYWGIAWANSRLDPLVLTSKGLIRGLRADDGDYSKFLGIPYAVVNESNPFGPAVPHEGFDDIFEAHNEPNSCVQVEVSSELPTGTIQCLKLNVFTPNNSTSNNLLPVLVYIHGGGWAIGSSANSRPKSLLQQDVVFVSINYRLGVFGFLCLDTPEVPGNQGLKDQVLALRWIKENIEAFGGDPSKITPFGGSAGGMSVNLHLYSDYENFFDRAIIQSGPALSYWLIAPSDNTMALKLSEHLGHSTNDTNDALSYLSSVDPYLVTSAAYDLKFVVILGRYQSKVKPCVEKKFEGVESFLSEHPMNIIESSKIKSSSIIIGYTDNELEFIYNENPEYYDDDTFKDSFYLGFDKNEDLDEALEEIKHFYTGDDKININVRQNIAKFGTDIIFAHPTQRMVEQFIKSGVEKVYRYVFSYNDRNNSFGAQHGADKDFLFDMSPDEFTEEKRHLNNRMILLWTNFAKFGNPTPEITDLLPIEWKPATITEQFSLNLNSELTLVKRPEHERMTFWDLFYILYGKYQMWYKD